MVEAPTPPSQPPKFQKPKKCKRLSAGASAQDRKAAHKAEMEARRARQRNRTVGFTPVHNARINAAIAAKTALYQLAGEQPTKAEYRAMRDVAAMLPALPMERRTLYRRRPSKSDSAAYRKAV